MTSYKVLFRGWLFLTLIFPVVGVASAFSLADLTGKEHALSDEKGKWVIINYWATWCAPCVKEIPELIIFHHKHKQKDAIVWGVNFEDAAEEKIKIFVEKLGVNYPILLAEPGRRSYFGVIKGLPTTYFISPEGKMVHTRVGSVTIKYIEGIMKQYAPNNKESIADSGK